MQIALEVGSESIATAPRLAWGVGRFNRKVCDAKRIRFHCGGVLWHKHMMSS